MNMKLLELKRSVKREPTSATIISDGCRDYVVAIQQPRRYSVLEDRNGKPMRFPCLAQARDTIGRADVRDINVATRIAADEACAGNSLQHSGFATLPLPQLR